MSRLSPSLPPALALALLSTPLACGDPEPGADTDDATDDDEGEGEAGDSTDSGGALAPTWHQDVAPIVAEKCGACHRSGGIAPFALSSYEQGADWAELALEAIELGDMPPWGQAVTEECEPRTASSTIHG